MTQFRQWLQHNRWARILLFGAFFGVFNSVFALLSQGVTLRSVVGHLERDGLRRRP